MKSGVLHKPSHYATCVLSVVALLGLGGCIPGRTERGSAQSLGLNSDRSFASNCSFGVYATHCWTLTIRNQRVTTDGTMAFLADTSNFTLPQNSTTHGTVSNIDVSGRYSGDIRPRISPALLAGTPPPVCALVAPIDGPKIATTVVQFRVTGSVSWNWGAGYTDSTGTRQNNVVLWASNLSLQRFDVQNLWSVADSELRSLLRNTVLREADAQIVRRMNEVFALGGTVPGGLPTYAPGVNPHSSGGFCN